jgi:hypothetical protein
MSSHLTHERCSELLADYLAGELDHEQHRLVEDHLEHCAQCSVERAGLAALRPAEAGEGLTGDERAMLRAGVLGAIRDSDSATGPLRDESDAVVVPLGGRGARAGKYLGIAAMLAILAVGSLFVFRGGGLGVSSGSDDSGAESAVDNAGDSDDSGQAGGGDEDTSAQGRVEESAPFTRFDIPPHVQSDRGDISESDLDRFGRQAAPALTSLADESADPRSKDLLANKAPEESLERLAARARAALALDDVSECGRTALEELARPGLATYATTATFEGEDVVIIAFVTGDRRPDRYAVFAFPRGDCTTILTSTEGPLE